MIPPLPHGLRVQDSYGSGLYGASRDGGDRHHMGIDFRGLPGERVIAPCAVMTRWYGYAYAGDKHYRSVHLDATNDPRLQIAMFYVEPKDTEAGEEYNEGDVIGYLQDLRTRYPADHDHAHAITPHTHLQITLNGALVDPTGYFGGGIA